MGASTDARRLGGFPSGSTCPTRVAGKVRNRATATTVSLVQQQFSLYAFFFFFFKRLLFFPPRRPTFISFKSTQTPAACFDSFMRLNVLLAKTMSCWSPVCFCGPHWSPPCLHTGTQISPESLLNKPPEGFD